MSNEDSGWMIEDGLSDSELLISDPDFCLCDRRGGE